MRSPRQRACSLRCHGMPVPRGWLRFVIRWSQRRVRWFSWRSGPRCSGTALLQRCGLPARARLRRGRLFESFAPRAARNRRHDGLAPRLKFARCIRRHTGPGRRRSGNRAWRIRCADRPQWRRQDHFVACHRRCRAFVWRPCRSRWTRSCERAARGEAGDRAGDRSAEFARVAHGSRVPCTVRRRAKIAGHTARHACARRNPVADAGTGSAHRQLFARDAAETRDHAGIVGRAAVAASGRAVQRARSTQRPGVQVASCFAGCTRQHQRAARHAFARYCRALRDACGVADGWPRTAIMGCRRARRNAREPGAFARKGDGRGVRNMNPPRVAITWKHIVETRWRMIRRSGLRCVRATMTRPAGSALLVLCMGALAFHASAQTTTLPRITVIAPYTEYHGGYLISGDFKVDPRMPYVVFPALALVKDDILSVRPLRLNDDEYLVLQE